MIPHSNIKVEQSQQNLTSDTGLLLIEKYLDTINLNNLFQSLKFSDNRGIIRYSNPDLLRFKLSNLLLGYHSQTMQARAVQDKLFTEVYNVPSQPTISRLFSRIDNETIASMNSLICEHTKEHINNLDTVILDADSTNIVCHGSQEKSKHNPHYNNHGYHPLIVTEANTGLVLCSELRSGNAQCAEGLEKHIKFIFDNFDLNDKQVMFRADSQFANSSKIELYELYNMDYAVKAMKRNKTLGELVKAMASEQMANTNESVVFGSTNFSSAIYNNINVSYKAEKVLVTDSKQDGQLTLFNNEEIEYQLIFSNIDIPAKDIFDFYNKRGSSENIFKELKQDFGMGNLSHNNFTQNEFEFLFSCFAYNVYKTMLNNIPQIKREMTLSLFIRNYLRFASKIVFHARQVILKIDAIYRYIKEFMNIYEHV